jgi:peptide/nickel transport system permease protein
MMATYFLSIVWPGAGHLLQKKKAGVGIGMFWLLHVIVLIFAGARGMLFGLQSSDEHYLLPSLFLVGVLTATWIGALLSLYRHRGGRVQRSRTYWTHAALKFGRDKKGVLGALLVGLALMLALFSPFLAPYNPTAMDLDNLLDTPSWQHPFGTDDYGQDILSRIVYGARIALGIGACATLINMCWGGFLGVIAGFYRGIVDSTVMRFLEVMNSIPYLVLVIFVIGIFGSSPQMLVVTLGLFGLYPARIIRSKVLSVREAEYVTAARALGAGNRYIIFRHIIPNSMAPLLVVTTMQIGINIIMVAGLSFLGFGVRPPTPSWGAMLQAAQQYTVSHPALAIFPGVAIMLTVLGFNLLGDSLRDALDPSLSM